MRHHLTLSLTRLFLKCRSRNMVMEEKTLAAGSQTLKKKHTDAVHYFRFYCSSLFVFLRFTCTTELGVNAVIHRLNENDLDSVCVCVCTH